MPRRQCLVLCQSCCYRAFTNLLLPVPLTHTRSCASAAGLFSRFDLVGSYFGVLRNATLMYCGSAGVGMAYAAMAEEEQKQQGSNPAVAHSVVEKPARKSRRGFAASNQ